MEFIKKHYEKVLLGLVLFGLIGVGVLLLFIIPEKRQKLEETRQKVNKPVLKPLTNLDMTVEEAGWKRLQTPMVVDLTSKHKTLNPVLWQLMPPDGHVRKVEDPDKYGWGATMVTNVNPIYFTVSYDTNSGNGYLVMYGHDSVAYRREDKTNNTLVSLENKNDKLFSLSKVIGPPENPTGLELVLKTNGQTFTIGPGKPFHQVEGYTVNLIYPPDTNIHFPSNLRQNDQLKLEGDDAKIDSIGDGVVVILSKSGKKYQRPSPDIKN
jgi:hypothetical protein